MGKIVNKKEIEDRVMGAIEIIRKSTDAKEIESFRRKIEMFLVQYKNHIDIESTLEHINDIVGEQLSKINESTSSTEKVEEKIKKLKAFRLPADPDLDINVDNWASDRHAQIMQVEFFIDNDVYKKNKDKIIASLGDKYDVIVLGTVKGNKHISVKYIRAKPLRTYYIDEIVQDTTYIQKLSTGAALMKVTYENRDSIVYWPLHSNVIRERMYTVFKEDK